MAVPCHGIIERSERSGTLYNCCNSFNSFIFLVFKKREICPLITHLVTWATWEVFVVPVPAALDNVKWPWTEMETWNEHYQ